MAAIDKLHLTDYYDFADLRNWILIEKPSLLRNLYSPFDTTYKTWEEWKEYIYKTDYDHVCHFFGENPTYEDYERFMERANVSKEEIKSDYNHMLELKERVSDKQKYKEDIKIAVTCFTTEQDRWLFWHCPLYFIRDYLYEQCGYKEKWYHKYIFKLTFKG